MKMEHRNVFFFSVLAWERKYNNFQNTTLKKYIPNIDKDNAS